jgi:probable rRNA maturation factor
MSASSKTKVYFFYETPVQLRNRAYLRQFIEGIFKAEGLKLESLNYIFCSDKRILKINQQFLQHNYYTDILTFELSEKAAPIQAEIYISAQRVKDNSLNLKEPFNKELLRVIIHGALHLCGYTDKTKIDKNKIRNKEDFYISLFETVIRST